MRPGFHGTFSTGWVRLGTIDATAAEADEALGVTERTLQQVKDLDNILWWLFPKAFSAVEIRFKLTTSDETADIDLYTGEVNKDPSLDATVDCDLQRKATLDVVCGQQKAYDSALLYADTIEVSNDASGSTLMEMKPGTDHMAIIALDMRGSNLLVFHGYGTFDEDCVVEVKGYS